ncbi:MAG: Holliday junction branch migration protein RuvA [Bacteroidota bacterium]|nr:Holliday junction branch migration protein RuvA [Bacteroidota bacterium]MDP3144461.1 Holliday junction branch migration protein RuvA [Bacteroidota bacterium]MDP3555861.1 Holliday junction branch migration protein RuvA [Bacteroidota bacterium]
MSLINYVKGQITYRNPAQIIIEANGVGYGLLVSLNTYSKLSQQTEAQLFIESVYIRDDNPRFYGFAEEDERELFRKLISVSGVGGGSALLMLSSHSPSEIAGAINTANVAMLKSIKGIGDKTAQRIVVDLKGKMGKHEGGISQILTTSYNKNKDEALLALVTLGFPRISAEKAIEKAIKQQGIGTEYVEILIKAALKNF